MKPIPIKKATEQEAKDALAKIKSDTISRLKKMYQQKPFITPLWLSIHTGLKIEFIKANWPEITN